MIKEEFRVYLAITHQATQKVVGRQLHWWHRQKLSTVVGGVGIRQTSVGLGQGWCAWLWRRGSNSVLGILLINLRFLVIIFSLFPFFGPNIFTHSSSLTFKFWALLWAYSLHFTPKQNHQTKPHIHFTFIYFYQFHKLFREIMNFTHTN